MCFHCPDCISQKIKTFLDYETLQLFPFSVSLNLVEDLNKLDSWWVFEKREFSHWWRNHCEFLILLWKSKFVRRCLIFRWYWCHLQYILTIPRKKLRKFQDLFQQLIPLGLFWRMSTTASTVYRIRTVLLLPELLLFLFKTVQLSCGYNEELISMEDPYKEI